MKYLKLFEDFIPTESNSDTLYFFDFDDTLVESPGFEDIAIKYLTESITIEELVDKSISWIGKSKSDLKIENGRIYVDDPLSEIEVRGNWVRKGDRVYLVAPNRFYDSDLSSPTSKKELANFYNSVENRAIVTGRFEKNKWIVEDAIKKFGLESPNFGLYCYPHQKIEKIPEWKGETIVKILKESGFKKAKFYDDRSKWVNKVVKIVKSQLPDVEFEGIKVS
jgi:hypothetical protein